jgi:uncharacterized protein YcbK (DUF882 family)
MYGGLTERQEFIFTWYAVVVILLFMTGWTGAIAETIRQQRESIAQARSLGMPPPPAVAPTQHITSEIFGPDKPTSTAYITDAIRTAIEPYRGISGAVRFATGLPGSDVAALASKVDEATSPVDDMSLITLVPFNEKQGGRIGLYYLGSWPFENRKPVKAAYANPSGFIEVTQDNADTFVSDHFRLRDFLTKDQPNVWPKYILLNPKLLDKLELTIQELQATGHPVEHMQVMSGFRTPNYNVHGGNTQGRANLSRHMYGDASDVFVDNDRNGIEDDLNHDGRIDVRDAEIVQQAADRVERKNPSLVGGVGVYSPCCGHGPFTHIDVRGFRARWRGFGNG